MTINSGEYKQNELVKPFVTYEIPIDVNTIKKRYKLPTAQEIEDEIISVDNAKTIATNSIEAGRMISESHKNKINKLYGIYKDLNGDKELKDINGIKLLINEISRKATIPMLKSYLKENNIKESEYKNLTKPKLINKVKYLVYAK